MCPLDADPRQHRAFEEESPPLISDTGRKIRPASIDHCSWWDTPGSGVQCHPGRLFAPGSVVPMSVVPVSVSVSVRVRMSVNVDVDGDGDVE